MVGAKGSWQDKMCENPSFYYAVQLDAEEHITNIFWADAKMLVDYAHFDDVVTFDTTFDTNKNIGLSVFLLASISLGRRSFLEPLFYLMKHVPLLHGYSRHF
jgi:hypothetical protein